MYQSYTFYDFFGLVLASGGLVLIGMGILEWVGHKGLGDRTKMA